jgi:hypothetical protein
VGENKQCVWLGGRPYQRPQLLLRTSDYPNFGIGKPVAGRVDSYLVSVGPFASAADAKDYCAHHGDWPGDGTCG